VHVVRGGLRAEPEELLEVKLKPTDEHLYESRDHFANFLECVRTRRDPVAPVEAGHAATTLTLVADIATRLQRKLTWDWKKEQFVHDLFANTLLRRALRSPWSV
jgi:transcriptional accessory protein Tex/SPT6